MAFQLPWESGLLGFMFNDKPLVEIPGPPDLDSLTSTLRVPRELVESEDVEPPSKRVRWTPKERALRAGWESIEADTRPACLCCYLVQAMLPLVTCSEVL
eukprot:4751391-Amphidinium_carterae.1